MTADILNPNTRLAFIQTQNGLDWKYKNLDHFVKSMKIPDLSSVSTNQPHISLSLSPLPLLVSLLSTLEEDVHKISLG